MLYEQIARNKRKTWFFIFLSFFIFEFLGYVISQAYFNGNLFLGIGGSTLIFILYFLISAATANTSLMALHFAKEIKTKQDFPMLWNICEDLAMASNLPMPKVYVIEDSSPNAFASGFSPNKASVAITTGLLERLNRQEVEAVMAHEFTHIKNYDIRLSTMVLALSSALLLILNLASRMSYYRSFSNSKKNEEGQSLQFVYVLVILISAILAPFVMTLIRLAISRKREYLADAGAVELTNNPDAMISALKKLSLPTPTKVLNKESASIYFINPFSKVNFSELFATHPPVEKRIEALKNL